MQLSLFCMMFLQNIVSACVVKAREQGTLLLPLWSGKGPQRKSKGVYCNYRVPVQCGAKAARWLRAE